MVQSGSSTGFPAESFEGLRVLGDVGGQELESHEAPQFGVLGLVDDVHAPATDSRRCGSARWFDRSNEEDFNLGPQS